MAKTSKQSKQDPPPETVAVLRPVLGEYYPFEALWSPRAAAPIFDSEGAARWFFRNHRVRLVQAKATVIHTGRILVHPSRCAAVAEAVAFEAAERRAGGDEQ